MSGPPGTLKHAVKTAASPPDPQDTAEPAPTTPPRPSSPAPADLPAQPDEEDGSQGGRRHVILAIDDSEVVKEIESLERERSSQLFWWIIMLPLVLLAAVLFCWLLIPWDPSSRPQRIVVNMPESRAVVDVIPPRYPWQEPTVVAYVPPKA